MTLLVDIGNTRSKWRYVESGDHSIHQGVVLNADVTLSYLSQVFAGFNIKKVFLSSVGHKFIANKFKNYALKNDIFFEIVKTEKKMNDLNFVYEDVQRLGVDRCLAMIGAYDGGGVLVIDAGSAITADLVEAGGRHCGGYILPGYEMSRCALLGKTAEIGVMASQGDRLPGIDTVSCVNNGFAVLYGSMLDGFIKVAKEIGISRYVITGGDAEMLKTLCSVELVLYENLVLDGLERYSRCSSGIAGVGL